VRPRHLLMAAVAALLCGAAPLTGRAMSVAQYAPLPGLGDEAVISAGQHPVVMVRKAAEVMELGCDECTRDQAIALARVAAAKLGTAAAVQDKLRAEAAKGSPLPCLQLLDARAVRAVLVTDLNPVAIPVFAGESNCSWWTLDGNAMTIPFSLAFVDQRAFLNKIMFPTATPSAAGVYNYEVWYRKESGMKAELLGAIGQHATAFAVDKGTELLVLRADGVIRMNSTLPREQLRALATRAANARSPVVGRHVSFPTPGEIKEAVAHEPDPQMRNAPCVQMLTEAEVRTAKRTEVLVDAVRRPGYSLCEWRATSALNTGFFVAVTTASEFKARGFAGASSYFAAEKKAMTTTFSPEVLYGLGNDAIQAEQLRQGVAMVRTGETVVTVTCFECNRFDAIVLARLAAVVK